MPQQATQVSWDDHSPLTPESWATSDRGWLHDGTEPTIFGVRNQRPCVAWYLDYGPDHYRSPHEYCRDNACECELSQPGHVLAVVVRRAFTDGEARKWKYLPTVSAAKAWCKAESGLNAPAIDANGNRKARNCSWWCLIRGCPCQNDPNLDEEQRYEMHSAMRIYLDSQPEGPD